MKSSVLKKIESKYEMPFADFIQKFHWDGELNFTELEKMTGSTRQSLINICKKLSIKRRSHLESITPRKGPDHWAFGLRKDNSKIYSDASLRMKLNNPSTMKRAKEKRARTIASTLFKRDLKQESDFRKILSKSNITFIEQHPIGPYNIDFFVPSMKLCIEIDSSWKWGYKKRLKAMIRDAELMRAGYWTLRINKVWLSDISFIHDILNAYNIVCD